MSITPLPAGTAALPAAPADLAGGAPGDGSFAALVATLLGQTVAGTAGSPVLVAGTTAPGGDLPGDVAAGDLPGDLPGDPADGVDPATATDGTAVVAPVWTPVLDGLVPVLQPAGSGPDATATAPVDAAGVGTGEAVSLPTPATYDGTGAPDPATGSTPGPAPDVTTDVTTDLTADLATVGTAGGAATEGLAASADPGPAVAATAPPTGPTAAVAAPGPAPTAAAAPAAPDGGARPAPVVAQVVPEVTRLVSRGDGVHRLTMRLQPEGLGDVRVTLTVRDGQVDVRLAAGDDARRALVEGAPELRRVLELTGATEARVLVRDLSGASAPSGQQAWTTTGQQAGQQDPWTSGAHGGGGDASGRGETGGQGQHAGTRGGAAARDGHTDGATALRPDPSGGAPRGVDLTM